MSNYKKDIEQLFKDEFEGFEMKPSNKVWNNLEKEILKTKFTRFNPAKFNIYYLSLLILAAIGIIFLSTANLNHLYKTASNSENITYNNNDRNIYTEKIGENQNDDFVVDNQALSAENKDFENKVTDENNTYTSISNINEIAEISNIFQLNIFQNSTNSYSTDGKNQISKFETSDCEGCAPLSVSFTNKIENADVLKWTFGNGLTSAEENPDCIYETSGQYVVCLEYKINENVGYFYDTVVVYQKPEADFGTNKSENILVNDEIEFFNESTNAAEYLWNFGDTKTTDEFEPVHSYSSIGNYTVKLFAISANNCIDSVISQLFVDKEKYNIIFPTAFTPNINGPSGGVYDINSDDNDVFYPAFSDPVEEYELLIYNRKGLLIFKSTDINIGWDGYFKNELVKSDVYVYIAKIKFANGDDTVKTGNVTLINKK